LFSQQYGYFETEAAIPQSEAQGLQETLWLWPNNETLNKSKGSTSPPANGEIDYAEFYSVYSNIDTPVAHYPGSATSTDSATGDTNNCTVMDQAGQFNVYGLAWTPTTITAYINGTPCIKDTFAQRDTETPPAPFNQPFFLNYTAALGINADASASGTTQFKQATTQIKWTRVWK
jgi:hypothetical protein